MQYKIEETQLLFSTNPILNTSSVKFQLNITGDISDCDITEAINNTLIKLGFFHKTLLTTDIQHEYIDAKRFVDLVFILLANTGCDLNQFHISPLSDDTFEITIQYEDSRSTTHAGELTKELLNLCQRPVDFESDALLFLHREIGEFIRYSLINNQDANAKLLSSAARTRNIPVLNLDQPTFKFGYIPNLVMQNGLVQFGYGVNSVKCLGSVPQPFSKVQDTFVFAERHELISCLAEANTPLNAQDPSASNCNRLNRALRTAQRITYPVTLRPSARRAYEYREVNNAVFSSIRNDEQLSLAYDYLTSIGIKKVAIESFTLGDQYRFLLLKNKVVAVSKLTCPAVVGDGTHTVFELLLIQLEQASTAKEHLAWKMIAAGDAEIATRLAIEGLQLDSVLEEGRSVSLRGHATPYNGGLTEDVTDLVPERFKTLAETVANATGLVILSGVDLIIEDISGDALAPNCVTVDIAAEPDLVTHCEPSQGSAVDVSAMILQELFKEGEDGRIPLVAITGSIGKTTTSRMLAGILQADNQVVGLACSDGNYINGKEQTLGDSSGLSGAHSILINEQIEVAILETARGGLIRYGIAFDKCDVGTCLNINRVHVGRLGVNSIEELADVKRQVLKRTSICAVLNADDPFFQTMLSTANAKSTVLVSTDIRSPIVQEQIEKDCLVVHFETLNNDLMISLTSKERHTPIIAVSDIPSVLDGEAQHNATNAMFAVALAQGLSVPNETIAAGLSKFHPNLSTNPARLNEIQGYPFRVVLDCANTAIAFHALNLFAKRQHNNNGKKIIILGVETLCTHLELPEIIESIFDNFDFFVINNQRLPHWTHQKYDRLAAAVATELISQGVDRKNIIEIPDSIETFEKGMSLAKPGDTVCIVVRASGAEKWDYINKLKT